MPVMTDEQKMEVAIQQAEEAKQNHEWPFGAAIIMQAKIPRIVIGVARHDLPHLLRERKFRIEHLAEDAGYGPEIVHGVSKDKIIPLFADIQRT